MKRLKDAAVVVALLSVTVFFSTMTVLSVKGYKALHEGGNSVAQRLVPVLDAVVKTVNGDPKSSVPEERQPLRTAVLSKVDKFEGDTKQVVGEFLGKADKQLTAMKETVDTTVDKADKQLTALQESAKPVVDKTLPLLQAYTDTGKNAAVAVKHVDEAVQDGRTVAGQMSEDTWNLLQGTEVAMTSVAQAGNVAAQAVPTFTEEAKKMGGSAVRIGDGVAREVEEFTRPKSRAEKVKEWLGLIPRIAIKLL